MQVSKIIEVLQSRYEPDQELMVDWWDEEHFRYFCEARELTIPDWYEAVIWYENSDGVDIGQLWHALVDELEREKE
jgi:hypothetical protein